MEKGKNNEEEEKGRRPKTIYNTSEWAGSQRQKERREGAFSPTSQLRVSLATLCSTIGKLPVKGQRVIVLGLRVMWPQPVPPSGSWVSKWAGPHSSLSFASAGRQPVYRRPYSGPQLATVLRSVSAPASAKKAPFFSFGQRRNRDSQVSCGNKLHTRERERVFGRCGLVSGHRRGSPLWDAWQVLRSPREQTQVSDPSSQCSGAVSNPGTEWGPAPEGPESHSCLSAYASACPHQPRLRQLGSRNLAGPGVI